MKKFNSKFYQYRPKNSAEKENYYPYMREFYYQPKKTAGGRYVTYK